MDPKNLFRSVKNSLYSLRLWLSEKLWYGEDMGETFDKRFEIFVIIGIALIAVSKILYVKGLTVPNLELIIPTLAVIGIFSLQFRGDGTWYSVDKYLGVFALVAVFLLDMLIWGPKKIYLFTWPAFIACWFLAKKKNLSFRGKFKEIAIDATLATAFLIILYDVTTAFGTWLLWGSMGLGSLLGVYTGQIPFTLYHLSSLIFVPPLVALGKVMTRVRQRSAVPQGVKVAQKVKA